MRAGGSQSQRRATQRLVSGDGVREEKGTVPLLPGRFSHLPHPSESPCSCGPGKDKAEQKDTQENQAL